MFWSVVLMLIGKVRGRIYWEMTRSHHIPGLDTSSFLPVVQLWGCPRCNIWYHLVQLKQNTFRSLKHFVKLSQLRTYNHKSSHEISLSLTLRQEWYVRYLKKIKPALIFQPITKHKRVPNTYKSGYITADHMMWTKPSKLNISQPKNKLKIFLQNHWLEISLKSWGINWCLGFHPPHRNIVREYPHHKKTLDIICLILVLKHKSKLNQYVSL